MDIFGGETITAPSSPELGGQEGGAAEQQPGNQQDGADDFDGDQHETDGDFDSDGMDGDGQADNGEQDPPPQDGQGDELILGKFKTQEDLAKAYTELQREFTRSRQQQGGSVAQQQSQATRNGGQQSAADADPNEMFWNSFKTDPMGTMQYMVQLMTQGQIAPIMEQQQNAALGRNIETVAKQYPQINSSEGMRQVMAKVADLANEFGNPQLAQQPTERILRMAAEDAFGGSKASAYEQGKRAGREDAANTRRTKQAANVPKGAKPPQQQQNLTPAEQIKANILAAGRGGGLFG